ncbi:MAG TPA: hypothetical protein VNT26_14100 [Candidatus Sulfotelmatobacter sp.]|nr:hypothetical protein [Candidatus Sulfotelmatobacter sp.]
MPPLPAQPSGPASLRLPGATLQFTVTINLAHTNDSPQPQPTISAVELLPASVPAPFSSLHPQSSSTTLSASMPGMDREGTPTCSLHKGHRVWLLHFQGQPAFLLDDIALGYLAWLFTHPNQPIHGLDLYTQAHPLHPKTAGLTELPDPRTGHPIPLAASARLQQANLSRDNRASANALRQEFAELHATLDSPTASEIEKTEAAERLEALRPVAAACATAAHSDADRAVRAVRRALQRLYDDLRLATDEQGQPHPVLRPFAQHLHQYLILPSSRRANPPGHLLYQPPPNLRWNQ